MIYKNIENNTLPEFINENVDALIYAIDVETYEILYSNKKTQLEFGTVDGSKCYEVLQKNKTQPCDFCPNLDLTELLVKDKVSYNWKHQNTLNNKQYLFRDLILMIDGRIVKVQIGIDISKEKALEEELIREKNHSISSFEALTNSTIEGLIISDENKKCIQVNDTVLEILGFTKEELVGKRILDFVSPKSKELVKNKIENQDEKPYESLLIKKDGSEFPVILKGRSINLRDKIIRVSAILDISAIKEKELEIKTMAYHDSLTSLPNRTLLLDRLTQFINTSSRNNNFGSLMFIDLDHFKMINDLRGHLFGDLLLKESAIRLQKIVRKGDTVSRFGGDEFVILIDTQTDNEEKALKISQTIANKIIKELSKVFFINEHEFKISASVGIMMFNGLKYSIDELLKFADDAMYHSKEKGRNRFTFFDKRLESANEKKRLLVKKLSEAIKNEEIEFYYQKQIDKYQKTIGLELLARWHDSVLGAVPTKEFIDIANEIGLIDKIDELVLRKALFLIRLWENDIEKKEWFVSINISLKQFERDDFISSIKDIIGNNNTNLKKLRIEITENLFSRNEESVIMKVNQLKKIGLNLSIDDFATGYFSLPYLKKLSIDEIKIDKQFVSNILTNKNDEAIVLSILEISRKFNFKVIVEGVETKEIFDRLIEMGFDNFQGFYISKPQSLEEI